MKRSFRPIASLYVYVHVYVHMCVVCEWVCVHVNTITVHHNHWDVCMHLYVMRMCECAMFVMRMCECGVYVMHMCECTMSIYHHKMCYMYIP